jgi:hypothetical protein
MVDPSLNGVYPAKSLSNFADIIARCLQVSFFFYRFSIFPLNSGPLTPSINLLLLMQPEPEFRPAMSEVVLYLLNMIKRESHKSDSNEK